MTLRRVFVATSGPSRLGLRATGLDRQGCRQAGSLTDQIGIGAIGERGRLIDGRQIVHIAHIAQQLLAQVGNREIHHPARVQGQPLGRGIDVDWRGQRVGP